MKIILTESQYGRILKEQFKKIKKSIDPNPKQQTSDGGCTTDTIKPKNWQDLYAKLVQSGKIKPKEPLVIVWGPKQTLYYTTDGNNPIKTLKVSTGANGFGNSQDDKKTPTGLIQIIGQKRGQDYEVMIGKRGTGTILGPTMDSLRVDVKTGEKHIAEVLTGIVELGGLESCNSNVKSRNIYFHGTNREQFLGQPRSNGCIRVSNENIKWLLDNINVGTKVYIKP